MLNCTLENFSIADIILSSKFSGHVSAAAWLCTCEKNGEKVIALRSYNTIVAYVDTCGYARVNGLFSATTIKHIGWFARVLGVRYIDLKRAYLNNCAFDTKTGDYIDYETGEILYSPDIDGQEYKTPDFKVA